MNIQQQKKSTNLLLVILSVICFTSCEAQKKPMITEILTGVEVLEENYEYSNESKFKLENIQYSLRTKAIYNSNGEIKKLIVYKPEGILEYDKDMLLKDTKLIEYYNFPLHQTFIFSDEIITTDDDKKIKVVKINEDYLLRKENGKVYFYRLVNK